MALRSRSGKRRALAALVVALVVLLAGCGGGCPKGQSPQIQYWVPVVVGRVVTIIPVYDCEPDRGR